jgi:hypothetical protein
MYENSMIAPEGNENDIVSERWMTMPALIHGERCSAIRW